MASVEARALIVLQPGPEFLRYGRVFNKIAVFSVCVVCRYRRGCDMFDDPQWIAIPAVKGRGCAESWVEIICWPRESILKEAVWVDRWDKPLELAWMWR